MKDILFYVLAGAQIILMVAIAGIFLYEIDKEVHRDAQD